MVLQAIAGGDLCWGLDKDYELFNSHYLLVGMAALLFHGFAYFCVNVHVLPEYMDSLSVSLSVPPSPSSPKGIIYWFIHSFTLLVILKDP